MFAKRTTHSKHGVWLARRGLPDGCVDLGLQEVDAGGESHSSKPVQYTTLHWPNMVNPVSSHFDLHPNVPICTPC